MKSAPSQTAPKLMVRLPDGLRDRIKQEAAKARRSMNAEVVVALEAAMAAKSQQDRPKTN